MIKALKIIKTFAKNMIKSLKIIKTFEHNIKLLNY